MLEVGSAFHEQKNRKGGQKENTEERTKMQMLVARNIAGMLLQQKRVGQERCFMT